MERKGVLVLALLTVGLFITNLWVLFPKDSVDWFLWYDREQSIHWYIYDTTEMIKISLLYYIIYRVLKYKYLRTITLIIFYYSLLRIADYWIYYNIHNTLLTIVLISILTIYISYIKKWKK